MSTSWHNKHCLCKYSFITKGSRHVIGVFFYLLAFGSKPSECFETFCNIKNWNSFLIICAGGVYTYVTFMWTDWQRWWEPEGEEDNEKERHLIVLGLHYKARFSKEKAAHVWIMQCMKRNL